MCGGSRSGGPKWLLKNDADLILAFAVGLLGNFITRRSVMRYAFDNVEHGVFYPPLSLDSTSLDSDGNCVRRFDVADESPSPEERAVQSQLERDTRAFLAALPPRDQVVAYRLYWLRESQSEIASFLGVSRMAVSKAVARISKKGFQALRSHNFSALSH